MIDHKTILDFFGPLGWKAAHIARAVVWRFTRPLRFGVAALIFNEAGQVLLVENSYWTGWRLPAGGVEKGETAYQSLVRELQEEVGLTPVRDAVALQGLYLQRLFGASVQLAVYTVRGYTGTLKIDGCEILKAEWFDPHNLPDGTVRGVRERVAEVLGMQKIVDEW